MKYCGTESVWNKNVYPISLMKVAMSDLGAHLWKITHL
jgi:hypothetical protein